MDDLLLQLAEISSTLYQATSPPVDPGFGINFDIPDFLLPFPELSLDVPSLDYLTNILADAGAPLSLARELSEIHARRSSELAEQYLQNYTESCLEIAGSRFDVGHETCMKMFLRLQRAGCRLYKQTMEEWEREMLQAVQDRCRPSKGKCSSDNRSAFNQDFTPVLETVFQNNPFPSPAVKRALAEKSGMTINQIKIWFQNHRSRARKNGVKVTKPNSFGTARKINRRGKNSTNSSASPSAPPSSGNPPLSSDSNDQTRELLTGPHTPSTSRIVDDKENNPCNPLLASAVPHSTNFSISLSPSTSNNDGHTYLLHDDHRHNQNSEEVLSDCETVIDFVSEGDDLHKSPLSRSSSVTLADEVDEHETSSEPCSISCRRFHSDTSTDKKLFSSRKQTDYSFPKPIWTRTPCSEPVKYTLIGISDLTVAFSKMSLGLSSRATDNTLSSETTGSNIVTGYPLITPTYSAPLPFLIRRIHASEPATPCTQKRAPLAHTSIKRVPLFQTDQLT